MRSVQEKQKLMAQAEEEAEPRNSILLCVLCALLAITAIIGWTLYFTQRGAGDSPGKYYSSLAQNADSQPTAVAAPVSSQNGFVWFYPDGRAYNDAFADMALVRACLPSGTQSDATIKVRVLSPDNSYLVFGEGREYLTAYLEDDGFYYGAFDITAVESGYYTLEVLHEDRPVLTKVFHVE